MDIYGDDLFASLKGETLIEIRGLEPGSGEVVFYTQSGRKFIMYHEQACCENVNIEDVVGDVEDLLHSPITLAEVVTNPDEAPEPNIPYDISHTWTYYKLATIKGYVDIRWLGESNGYYSESVTFREEK